MRRAIVAALALAAAVSASPRALGTCPLVPTLTFTVDTTTDGTDANPADCICATTGGQCTLRAAIMQANQTAGATIVIPARASPYTLTIAKAGADDASTGDLNILRTMTIAGGGAAGTIVDAGMLDGVFNVHASSITVSISGMTIQHGSAMFGGAILSDGTDTTLNVTGCVIRDNVASDLGGGIFTYTPLRVSSSTISGNVAGNGGGILSWYTDTAIDNSTISGNQATASGGGVSVHGGTLHLRNATVTNNQADADFDGGGTGGGVYETFASVYFKNTILAGNYESMPFLGGYLQSDGDCAGTITSEGNDVVQNYDTGRCTVNGSFTLHAPGLGPLHGNGGPTPTHALLAGSPAINAGSSCVDSSDVTLHRDQRGAFRPTSGCDIGAYEKGTNGDANADGVVGVADVFYAINFLFAGGPAPLALADVNGDGQTNVADVFYLINFLFAGGPAPL
jgi:CSLREA domain-containing protein